MLLGLLEWRLGEDGVEAVIAEAGDERSAAVLRDDATWSTYDQFRRLLEAAARHLGSPDELLGIGDMPSVAPGSRPEVTALLQSYGSPIEMARVSGDGGMGPILDRSFEALGPTELAWRIHLAEGYEPFPELCKFLLGVLPLSVRIFGLRPREMSEDRCRNLGDDECVMRIAWDETEDLSLQLECARFQLEVAESRLGSMQQTVQDIVSTDDLDTVMNRIVEAAARSSTAAGFVLDIDGMPGGARRYANGLGAEEAERAAARSSGGAGG